MSATPPALAKIYVTGILTGNPFAAVNLLVSVLMWFVLLHRIYASQYRDANRRQLLFLRNNSVLSCQQCIYVHCLQSVDVRRSL